jgi:hypothetical protein
VIDPDITDVPDLPMTPRPVAAAKPAPKPAPKPAAPVAAVETSTGDSDLDDLLATLG